MGIRDLELQRLIHYGKALGVKITMYDSPQGGDSAEWALDGSYIKIFSKKNKSKTGIILDLIHEIGHAVWFIHEKDRKPDLKFEEAITRENLYQTTTDVPTPKNLRKRILDLERAGIKWWDVIIKDTNIKIPSWKVELAKEMDIWVYEVYYETGHFPTKKERKAKFFEAQKRLHKKKGDGNP